MTRLVEDRGWIMNGELAQRGSRGVIAVSRSWISRRAFMRSVPGLKTRRIDESWETDLERITSRPSIPLRPCSSGTDTSSSTSRADRPEHSVWISTRGGANSGKASIGISRSCRTPKNITSEAPTTTRYRSFRLVPMIQRIMARIPQR
jgi:hypothetical protein